MYKIIFFSFFFIFLGCTNKHSAVLAVEKISKVEKNNKKLFPSEDRLIMFALRAEQVKDYYSAAEIFGTLYDKSLRKEYLYRALQNQLYLKKNKQVISKVDSIAQGALDDSILIRLKVIALIQENSLEEAKLLSIALVQESGQSDDYILVSDIYIAQGKFDEAVKYLEGAYLQEYSEKILDRMSIILYVDLKRKKDAIAQLETHTRIHGCSILICKRLIAFYSNDNNADGLLSAYLRYYKLDPKPEVSKQIVLLYGYKQEYAKLILFLERSSSDDDTLLQLYISSKNYKKAFPLAQKIYEDTGDVEYLGQSVIYEYENQKNKNDKVFLTKIAKRFEELLAEDSRALYLNYYGYILIDHDVDVKKGMKYVQKALELQPETSYYLDSMAWGHYKLGECKKALKIIQKVRTLDGGDDPEVILHHEKIKKCKGKK